jgi:hypothetical protein
VTEASQPPAQMVEDDPSIPDDEILYRRLSYDHDQAWVVRDLVTGQRVKPASGAFKPDADGVSVFRHSLLAELEPPLGAANLVVAPENAVVGFTVEDLRSLLLGVKDDQWPGDVRDPKNPIYAAHALIKGLSELGTKERKRRQKQISELPSMTFAHVP